MTPQLIRLRVAGFRSLRDVTVDLAPVTVLIGPNGSGRTNLLGALDLLQHLARGALQSYVALRGGASFLLHYGPRTTAAMELEAAFVTPAADRTYDAQLAYRADEGLVFLRERSAVRGGDGAWRWTDHGAGHRESALPSGPDTVRSLLDGLQVFHFSDTSRRSPLRTRDAAQTPGHALAADGSNLAAVLLALRDDPTPAGRAAWERLLFNVQAAAPFVRELRPVQDAHGAILTWLDETGAAFGPSHLSDGTLRALALFTALELPATHPPLLAAFDEPELGLNPAVFPSLAGALRSASTTRQILIATQSLALLDAFEPEEVRVAERRDQATTFRALDRGSLAGWLVDHSLGELYESNLLGGRP